MRRNIERFPSDFMFELTENEWEFLRSQIGTLKNEGRGQHPKYLPYAFTEQGVAQLSSVLNSPFAIKVNIAIIRAFVVLRQYAVGYAELNNKLEIFMRETNMQFNEVYQALTELAEHKRLPDRPRLKVGYFTEQQIKNRENIIE